MFMMVILSGNLRPTFPGRARCGYCATAQNQRKTGRTREKPCIIRSLTRRRAPYLTDGTATRS